MEPGHGFFDRIRFELVVGIDAGDDIAGCVLQRVVRCLRLAATRFVAFDSDESVVVGCGVLTELRRRVHRIRLVAEDHL